MFHQTTPLHLGAWPFLWITLTSRPFRNLKWLGCLADMAGRLAGGFTCHAITLTTPGLFGLAKTKLPVWIAIFTIKPWTSALHIGTTPLWFHRWPAFNLLCIAIEKDWSSLISRATQLPSFATPNLLCLCPCRECCQITFRITTQVLVFATPVALIRRPHIHILQVAGKHLHWGLVVSIKASPVPMFTAPWPLGRVPYLNILWTTGITSYILVLATPGLAYTGPVPLLLTIEPVWFGHWSCCARAPKIFGLTAPLCLDPRPVFYGTTAIKGLGTRSNTVKAGHVPELTAPNGLLVCPFQFPIAGTLNTVVVTIFLIHKTRTFADAVISTRHIVVNHCVVTDLHGGSVVCLGVGLVDIATVGVRRGQSARCKGHKAAVGYVSTKTLMLTAPQQVNTSPIAWNISPIGTIVAWLSRVSTHIGHKVQRLIGLIGSIDPDHGVGVASIKTSRFFM